MATGSPPRPVGLRWCLPLHRTHTRTVCRRLQKRPVAFPAPQSLSRREMFSHVPPLRIWSLWLSYLWATAHSLGLVASSLLRRMEPRTSARTHAHWDRPQRTGLRAAAPAHWGIGRSGRGPIETSPESHAPRALLRLRQRVVRILDLLETRVRLLDAVLVLVCAPAHWGLNITPPPGGCVGSGAFTSIGQHQLRTSTRLCSAASYQLDAEASRDRTQPRCSGASPGCHCSACRRYALRISFCSTSSATFSTS